MNSHQGSSLTRATCHFLLPIGPRKLFAAACWATENLLLANWALNIYLEAYWAPADQGTLGRNREGPFYIDTFMYLSRNMSARREVFMQRWLWERTSSSLVTQTDICIFWTYIGQIKKGGKDRRQTSKWFGEVPTDTDSSASTNTGEIVKSEYVLKISIFWVTLGGKQFNLKNDGSFICATNYQGGFVVIGGTMMGKVDRWGIQTIQKLISYLF